MHTVHLPQHTTLLTLFRKPTIFVKALCLLLLVGFLGIEGAKGQVTLATYRFNDNLTVESGSIGSPSLTFSITPSYNAGLNSTNALSTGTGTNANGAFVELTISTSGYTGITVGWSARTSNASTPGAWVLTGNSGSGFGSSIGTIPTLTTTFASTGDIALGSAFDNKSSIVIRITANNPSTRNLRIEDLVVKGTASSSSPSLAITGTTAHSATCVGSSASSIQYTITNNGSVAASGVSVASSNNSEFAISTALSSSTIAANGGTATYSVTFTPSATGARTSTVTVTSTTGGSNSPTSSLTGTGSTPVTAAVTSSAASSVAGTTATLNGNLTTLGVCPATTEKGFVYSLTSANATPTEGGSGVTKQSVGGLATGAYTYALAGLTQGTGYSFRSYVFDGSTYIYGSVLTFTTTTPPSNDDCSNATSITVDAAAISGTNVAATKSSPSTFTALNNYTTNNSPDVWYTFTASCTGNYVVTATPTTSFDIVIAAFSGGSCPNPTYLSFADANAAGTTSAVESITISATAGVTYRIMVFGYTAATGSFNIGVTGPTLVNQAVTTNAASSITALSATLNGNVTALGNCPPTNEKGFVYALTSDNSNPQVGGLNVTKTSVATVATGAYTLALSSLTPGTSYSFNTYVYDGSTYTYGTATSFTTLSNPSLAVTGTTAHGSTCPNTAAGSRTYTITNTGSDASNVVVTSSDPQFVVSNLSSTTIIAGGTATYDVIFTPTSAGAKTATITVYYNTSTQATTSSLTGTGTTPVTATVTTSAASSVVNTTATLNGNVTTLGVCPATTEKGFVYSATATNSDPLVNGTGVTKTSVASLVTGAYTLALTGLTPATGYTVKAYVYDGTSYTYGAAQTFTTLSTATKLAFGTVPASAGFLNTNLSTFTVQALRADNTLDPEYTGTITLTSTGTITGTTAALSGGTASFAATQFTTTTGSYTITASLSPLTSVTSSTITVYSTPSSLGTYTFTGTACSAAALAASSVATNTTFANASVTGQTCNNNSGTSYSVGGSNWGSAFSASRYIEVSVTANSGYTISLNNLSFSYLRTSAGAQSLNVRSSADNYATDLLVSSLSVGTSSNSTSITLSGAGFLTQSSAVTFRIYGWGGSSTGDLRLDNISISGVVAQGPTATVSNTSFNQFTTQNLARNTSNNPVSRFRVDVTNGTTVLSASSFSTPNNGVTNNYVGGTDVNNFKLWYGTTTDFASATQIGTTQTAVNNNPTAGETVSFSSLATSLPIGTYYFWVSADVLSGATSGKTITVNAPSLTLSTGTVAGSTTNTGTQTFIAGSSTNYYLNGNNASTAGNWFTGTGGTGTALGSLTAADVNLIVDDETNASISGDLTLGNNSKIIVSQGATAKLTIAGVGVTGTIDVGSAGTLVITSSTIPTLGTLATGSTVTYDLAGNQTSTAAASYGNVTLGGSGVKTLASSVSLTGTLTIPSGVTLDASNTTLSGTGSIDVQAGATLIIGSATGINGFNGTSGSSNYSTGANYTYNGSSSQVLGSALPSTVNNLTISNGNPSIALNGSTTVNGTLTLSGGTKLSIGSSTLTLNGTVSGIDASNCLKTTTSSNITVGGSGAVGTLYFDATTNALNNLTINNSYTSGAAITLGNTLNVSGVITPTAGQLATGGNLVLVSTNETGGGAIGNASANTAFANNYITGNVTGQRYTRAQRGYRALGHPFTSAQNLGILTDDFAITGLTSLNGTYASGSGVPTAFLYDPTQTAGSTSVLTRLYDATANIWTPGRGLYVFVRGAANEGMGGSGAGNYSGGHNPVTIDGTGTINQGAFTYNLTYGGVGKDNYNLIGNPYPSPINLKNVTGISSFGTVYVYNPIVNLSGGNQYTLSGGFSQYTIDGSDIIVPAFGAFYVQATANGQSLTFNETDKAVGNTPQFAVFGTEKRPAIRLAVANANGVIDELKLGINNGSSDASTDKYDASKLSNSLFNFYSLSSDRKALAIDYRANLNNTIPLGIQTNLANSYTISLSELTDLPNTQLVLRDKLLKTETILSNVGDGYTFSISADTATKGENRFEIGLLGTTVLPVQIADITAQLQADKTVAVNWTSTTEVNLAKYHVQRSKDGSNFTTVGTVAAKGASAYSYNDDLSVAGVLPSTIYYRLEAVDKDGSKAYSKVVAVALGSNLAKAAINIYPNPVQATLYAQVTVTKAGAAQLRVIDAQGKVVATQKTQLAVGTTSVSIPAAQLTAGSYVLEIDSADGKQTQRFVKE